MTTVLFTALAGGFGAATRFALDAALARPGTTTWIRLMIINVSGSLLLGLLTGLAARSIVPRELQLVLGAGFLGGYTTFSAASLATVELVEQRRWVASLVSSLGMMAAATGGAALGLVAGLRL